MISEPKEPSAQEEDLHNLAETLDSARAQFARCADRCAGSPAIRYVVNADVLIVMQRLADLLDKEAASLLKRMEP